MRKQTLMVLYIVMLLMQINAGYSECIKIIFQHTALSLDF